jgi:putative membrane protein
MVRQHTENTYFIGHYLAQGWCATPTENLIYVNKSIPIEVITMKLFKMKLSKLLLTGTFLCVFGAICNAAMAKDTVDADDFVEHASAAGVAEIETGKLALQKSTAVDIKAFAQQVINDHTATNKELAAIAKKKNLKVSTEAELLNKAKALVLKQRDGESFDEAYAKNQVKAHEDAIELFKKASVSTDVELASFAVATLPKLEHHLYSAQALVKVYQKK